MTQPDHVGWITSEKSRRAKSAVAVALSFAIIFGGMAFVGWQGYGVYMNWKQKDDYIGDGDEEVEVVIRFGSGWATVADSLMSKDVIKDPSLFEKAALRIADGPEPGTWKLKTHLPAQTAAEWLTDPTNQVVWKVTFPEGYWVSDILDVLVKKLELTPEELAEAVEAILADPKLADINPAAKTALPVCAEIRTRCLEGFLFPATYNYYPPLDTDPISAIGRLAWQFTDVLDDLDFVEKAKALGLSTFDAVIIASLIESEVSRDEDRPKVARAIMNRLAQDMPLQIDSVIDYGLNDQGASWRDAGALQIDTPYNVYLHKGLPPTPTSNPGKASLEAAVNPVAGQWLYWVTVNLETGETRFAVTLDEHQANVALLDQWCSQNPGYC